MNITTGGEQMVKSKDTGLFEVNHGEIDGRVFLLFIQTAELVMKYTEALLNKAGLSQVKFMVLKLLQVHGGTLTPSEIARLLLREKNDISTLIRRLEKDQLVKIEKNPKHYRSIHVSLTDKGKQTIIDITPTAKNIVKQVMFSVPDSSAAVLEESLKSLRRNAYNGLVKYKNTDNS